MATPIECYLGLGSNLGRRVANLQAGIAAVRRRVGPVLSISKVYESAPWGPVPIDAADVADASAAYLNAVAAGHTKLRPEEVLDELLSIEYDAGRRRTPGVRNEARTLDLDLLYYGNEIIVHDRLSVPHPRLHARRFVLAPLCELAPNFVDPRNGRRVCQLLEACEDEAVLSPYPHDLS